MVTAAGPGEMTAEEPLTTKEGWRRFADRQTAMPELPGPAVLAAMTARERAGHDEARQAYHADLPLANTPVIQRVVATTRLLIQLNRHQVSARRGVIVSGPSGTGKTTAPQRRIQGGDQRPPLFPLGGGAVGERGGRDDGEPAGDLPARVPANSPADSTSMPA